ncbi:MAG TPA: hypothetical protein VGC84_17330 [Ilumatobacteraceae bacterium]
MIRLAWLQARTQTVTAMIGLAVVATVLLVSGPNLAHLYATLIAPCAVTDSCSESTIREFLRHDREIHDALQILVMVVPGIIGIFWGAPLVAREIEARTFLLAWTQSVTRTRWLATKLGVIAVASMAVAGLLSLMSTWWNHPLDRVVQNAYSTFDARNIAPIGHAIFGFALGVTAGVLIRRTLPAMATVAVVFTAARLAITHWVRPLLYTPVRLAVALDVRSTGVFRSSTGALTLDPSTPRIANAWIVSSKIVDGSGAGLTRTAFTTICPQLAVTEPKPAPAGRTKAPDDVRAALETCVTNVGKSYHLLVSYHPASRYWSFQWFEVGAYIAAAIALAALCVWSVRRRSV